MVNIWSFGQHTPAKEIIMLRLPGISGRMIFPSCRLGKRSDERWHAEQKQK